MQDNKKIKLGIVSSYGDYCANSTYVKAIKNVMQEHFDTDIVV